jgi:hypothetical protein
LSRDEYEITRTSIFFRGRPERIKPSKSSWSLLRRLQLLLLGLALFIETIDNLPCIFQFNLLPGLRLFLWEILYKETHLGLVHWSGQAPRGIAVRNSLQKGGQEIQY